MEISCAAWSGEDLDESLRRAVARGTLLAAAVPGTDGLQELYFLNSPKGRAAVKAIAQGQWSYTGDAPAAGGGAGGCAQYLSPV